MNIRLCMFASASAVMVAVSAHAQTVSGPGAPGPLSPTSSAARTGQASSSTLGEVVVTASRVASSAQKTPVALNVYSEAKLQSENIHSLDALQSIDPSINITTSNGAAYVAIRGIASTDVTEIGDPAVPIARDDFFVNRSYTINTSLYDLNRIEVLKGPQGTLFGRNSTGGLISIITQQPTDNFGGYAQVGAGNYGAFNSEGALNIPVSDQIQLRFSGMTDYHSGYRYLTPVDAHGDDDRTESGRAEVAIEPFAHFRAVLSYQNDETADVGDVDKGLPIGVVSPIGDVHTFANYEPTHNHLVGNREHWEFTYDALPFGLTATYDGGYDSENWHHTLDASQLGGAPLAQFVQHEHPDTWNHEIRFATNPNQPFTAQFGAFYFHETNTLTSGELEESGQYAGAYEIFFPYTVYTKSVAGFGQVGYEILPNLRLTLGARYTSDQKTREGTSNLRCDVAGIPSFLDAVIGCVGSPPILSELQDGNISESKPTYHAGLDWQATSVNLLYAKYDTGYKSGGFNSNGSGPSVDYGPETVRVIEVGSKNRFFDRRLELNVDGFHTNYEGYQASQTSSVLSGGGIFNVGSAEIYGAEAEAIALLDGIGRFDANMTYLHSAFGSGIIVYNGASTPQPFDVGHNELPNAPTFVANFGFERTFNVPTGGLTARIEGKYSSSFYFDVFNNADTVSPAYATGNAMLTYRPSQGRWEAEIFVKNFTNQTVLANAARNYISLTDNYEFQPPLTFGGRVKYSF